MKIIVHEGSRDFGTHHLVERFPDIDFAVTRTVDDVTREIAGANIMIISNRPYDAEMVKTVNANQTALEWIFFTTSGFDKSLKAGGFPDNVRVANGAGLAAPMLVEHSFFLFAAINRRFRAIEDTTAKREWARDTLGPTMTGLRERTIAIFGMGATGQQAARVARAYDMTVLAVSRAYDNADGLVDEVFAREQADDALARADYVLLAMPSTAETRNFFDAKRLAAMKKGAVIVNIARGDLIDSQALADACTSGHLGGAGIDVTPEEPNPADSPLWNVPNIIVTPHVAAAGYNTRGMLRELIIDNIQRYADGRPIRNEVDWKAMMQGAD